MFRSVLAEVVDGIRSTAEADLRDLIETGRLPMPLFNASLYDGDTFLGKPDAWWPDAGVALRRSDSRSSGTCLPRTGIAHGRVISDGGDWHHRLALLTTRHTHEPATVARTIRDALERGLHRPPLPIRTVPCTSRIQ